MHIKTIVLSLCVFTAVAAHAEKKVYKCTNADGSTVFSPYPCGTGAQEMKVDTSAPPSPAPMPADAPVPGAAPPATAGTTTPAAPTVDAEDEKCRQNAERLKVYPAQGNLDMLMQRQTELMRSYAATAAEATKVQIGNLDGEIAAEQARLNDGRQRADRAYADAIAKCDARKAAHVAAHP